jgi:hypothetical protein
MVIENGVQSCLQVSSMYQDKVIQSRLLRARARFAAGLRGAAHQGKIVASLPSVVICEGALTPPSVRFTGHSPTRPQPSRGERIAASTW